MGAKHDNALQERFIDLDDLDVYKLTEVKAGHAATRNFVVEFGLKECRIAFDLDDLAFEELLRTPNPPGSVRWM
jgi:hypothetical protein